MTVIRCCTFLNVVDATGEIMSKNGYRKHLNLRVASQLAGVVAALLTVCIFVYELSSNNDASAQSSQSGNGNVQIGGNSTGDINSNNINIGELNIVIDEKLGQIENASQRNEALELATVIERLVREGQLQITPPAVQSLMDEIILLAKKNSFNER